MFAVDGEANSVANETKRLEAITKSENWDHHLLLLHVAQRGART